MVQQRHQLLDDPPWEQAGHRDHIGLKRAAKPSFEDGTQFRLVSGKQVGHPLVACGKHPRHQRNHALGACIRSLKQVAQCSSSRGAVSQPLHQPPAGTDVKTGRVLDNARRPDPSGGDRQALGKPDIERIQRIDLESGRLFGHRPAPLPVPCQHAPGQLEGR